MTHAKPFRAFTEPMRNRRKNPDRRAEDFFWRTEVALLNAPSATATAHENPAQKMPGLFVKKGLDKISRQTP